MEENVSGCFFLNTVYNHASMDLRVTADLWNHCGSVCTGGLAHHPHRPLYQAASRRRYWNVDGRFALPLNIHRPIIYRL